MAENPPSVMLKVIWMIHFVLSSWAMLSGFLAVSTYWYTHVAVLAFGFWAIVANESLDAVLMFILSLAVSVLNDIILLGIYEPRAHDDFEVDSMPSSNRNEYRFALGMCITNLILKPVSLFLLFRIYQSRKEGTDFNTGIPGFGGSFGGRVIGGSGYDNIENSPNTDIYGKSSAPPPQYQAPTYQDTPSSGGP